MRKYAKSLSLTVCAALLLSGCNSDTAEVSGTGPVDTTASVSEVTPAPETTTTTVSAEVAAIDGEDDERAAENDNMPTDIMSLPYKDFIGKRIICENSSSLHLFGGTLSEGFYEGEAPQKDYNGNVIVRFDADKYRFSPSAKYSSGAMSLECDNDFIGKVQSARSVNNDSIDRLPTTIYIGSVSRDTVYADKIEYGYTTNYGSFYVFNAFVRKDDKYSDNKYSADDDHDWYEYIIDPMYMHFLQFPMLEQEAKNMKFSVNGTEFYADTVKGHGMRSSMAGDRLDDSGIGDKYVYARVTIHGTDFIYDNIGGASCSADICNIEVITEDTDSIIKGTAAPMYEADGSGEVLNALLSGRAEFLADKAMSFNLIDLDFDGTPEALVQEIPEEEYALEGPYATANTKVYSLKGGNMKLLGDFDIVCYEPFDEAVYLPAGVKGWHFTEGKNHCLLTLKNDTLSVERINECRGTDDGSTEYYCDGKKIEREPVEGENLFLNEYNKDWDFGKWTGFGGVDYYAAADWEIYQNLYETLDKYFYVIKRYNINVLTAENAGNIRSIDIDDKHLFGMVDAFYTSKLADTANMYYGMSFEFAKEKPVIYLYPEEQTDVSVKVNFPFGGEFTCTYPEYDGGWNVTANPDGTLYDADGDEYYCLYWEGRCNDVMDSSRGFCVKGSDTADFLREKLMYIGLTAREANEFIIYWLPRMQDNPYNIITLHTADYAASVPLDVSPRPDTQIRVFMTYYASDTPVDIPEQTLPHFDRTGFTLVEWGGGAEAGAGSSCIS